MSPGTDGNSQSGPGNFWPSILGGLLAALLFLAVWLPAHPAQPLMSTADLFTPLSVARHLVQGDGFQTDITYPLSFAFPFAQELPQPLIHRGPGYSLVLVLPYLAADQDPATTVTAVRWLQVGLLGLIVLTGAVAFLRRGLLVSPAAWMVLLGSNGLMVFAVDWGFEELLAGWLLLCLWLRNREAQGPTCLDGVLAGMLVLIRLDLFWVPLLWWVWVGLEARGLARRKNSGADDKVESKLVPPGSVAWSKIFLAVAVMAVLQVPWAVRNTRLTGQPFFSLQAQAELVKDTSAWPGYSVYKQLTPQPLPVALAENPEPLMRKIARGLKFFATNLPRLVAMPYLILGLLLVFVLARGKVTDSPCPFRRDRDHPMTILPGDSPLGPFAAAFFTLSALAVQYSFFDHSLRHLLVLLPVLAWEVSPLTGDLPSRWRDGKFSGWKGPGRLAAKLVLSGLVTLGLVWLTTAPLDGWLNARQQARNQAETLPERVANFKADPAPVVFVGESALPWYADRPAVWDPEDETVRSKIRRMIEPSP